MWFGGDSWAKQKGADIYVFLLSRCCIFFSTFLACRCSQPVFVCLLEDAICYLSFLLKYVFEAMRVMHLTVQIQQHRRILAGERAPLSNKKKKKEIRSLASRVQSFRGYSWVSWLKKKINKKNRSVTWLIVVWKKQGVGEPGQSSHACYIWVRSNLTLFLWMFSMAYLVKFIIKIV